MYFKGDQLAFLVIFMLFICLCDVFNMLLDKPCANPLINTIAEYFLLKTVLSERLSQKRGLKQPSVCYITIQQPITSRDRFLSLACKIYQYQHKTKNKWEQKSHEAVV